MGDLIRIVAQNCENNAIVREIKEAKCHNVSRTIEIL